MGRLFLVTILTACAACGSPTGASTPPEGPAGDWRRHLEAAGLVVIPEARAGVPTAARGRWIPVLLKEQAPLSPHPGGYLIVAIVDEPPIEGADAMAARIARWGSGERLTLRVRRNPAGAAGASWWESDLVLVRPR